MNWDEALSFYSLPAIRYSLVVQPSAARRRRQGEDVDTGERLYSMLPAQVTVTAGARFFDRKLTAAPNWRYVTGVDDDDPDTDHDDYHLSA